MKQKLTLGACVDIETYRKVRMMYLVKHVFFQNKDITISSIVQDALEEYFDKHADEYQKMIDEYHEKGGFINL